MIEIEIYPGIFEEVKSVDFGTCKYYPKAMLVMADEMTEVVEGDNYKLVNSIKESISSIARLGRAAACHLALATQRPSGNVISSDLKNNIHQSVILGDFDTGASTLIFDEDISHKSKPHIKGRGFIKAGKEIIETQTYWTVPSRDFVLKEEPASIPLNKEESDIQEQINKNSSSILEEEIKRSDESLIKENESTHNLDKIEDKEDLIPDEIKEYKITIDDILGDEEEDLSEMAEALESVSEGHSLKININKEEKTKEERNKLTINISNEELLSEFSNIKLNLPKNIDNEDNISNKSIIE